VAFNQARTAPRYRQNPKGVKTYLKLCQKSANRARALLDALAEVQESAQVQAEIHSYLDHVELFANQVRRRILDGETISHEEKVFSIHKPHTRWVNKGKAGVVAELGLPVAVAEDAYQFILAYHILWTGSDVDVAVPLIDTAQATYPEFKAYSFDRGFHSAKNGKALDARLTMNVLLKKGWSMNTERNQDTSAATSKQRTTITPRNSI
jgi:hypothetical protein